MRVLEQSEIKMVSGAGVVGDLWYRASHAAATAWSFIKQGGRKK